MSTRFRFLAFVLLGLFLTSMLLASGPPPLVGSYKIAENTDLGSQVRLSLELDFINPTDTAITVKSVSLHSLYAPGHMVTSSLNLIVQGHSKSQVTLQYILSKKDYSTWSAGPQQQFVVGLQAADGKPAIANVMLRRTN